MAEDLQHCCSHLAFVAGVTGDEVLHVGMATRGTLITLISARKTVEWGANQTYPFEDDPLSIAIDDVSPLDTETGLRGWMGHGEYG